MNNNKKTKSKVCAFLVTYIKVILLYICNNNHPIPIMLNSVKGY